MYFRGVQKQRGNSQKTGLFGVGCLVFFSFLFSHLLLKPFACSVPAIKPSAGTCRGGDREGKRTACAQPQPHHGQHQPTAAPGAPTAPVGLIHTQRGSGPKPGAACTLTKRVHSPVPLTIYCPSFGVSSSSWSCCLLAWKSSSERHGQMGAAGGCGHPMWGASPNTSPKSSLNASPNAREVLQ